MIYLVNTSFFIHRNINSKETLAKAATNITESLLELNQTMDAQVRKGNLTLTTLGKYWSPCLNQTNYLIDYWPDCYQQLY